MKMEETASAGGSVLALISQVAEVPPSSLTPSQAEVAAILTALTTLSPWQLKELAMKENAPAWVVGYAVAILKDIQAGKTTTLERIARRVAAAASAISDSTPALPLQLELFSDT